MNEVNRIKTPMGATLGERVNVEGRSYLKYKCKKTIDFLSPEKVVELITGCKVKEIVYQK